MISVHKISNNTDLQKAFAIRDIVFVQEQGCPADLEHEHDDMATHFLTTVDHVPAAAARWRKTDAGYKLERFAVLKAYRRQGLATVLIRAVLADLPADARYIYLNAQTDAIPVYEKSGFVPVGEPFEEAGIRHMKMVKASS